MFLEYLDPFPMLKEYAAQADDLLVKYNLSSGSLAGLAL
jgi:hypothetical protein